MLCGSGGGVGEGRRRVGDRRIDGELGQPFGRPVLGSGVKQALGEDVAVALAIGALRGDEDLAMLLEVHQPIGHGEVVDVEQLAMALERGRIFRSEEHTSELQSLMRQSSAVFCLKQKKKTNNNTSNEKTTND